MNLVLRRALVLTVLCYWHLTATAQITVTSSTFPVVGDTLHAAQAVSPGPLETFAGPPGFNIHWDASYLVAGQRIATLFRAPSAGVYSSAFPAANMMTTGSGAEVYYRTSNGSLEILGVAGNARGAPTDTFGADYVAVFTPSQVQRPPTISFFDVRGQSIDCIISLPSPLPFPVGWPESLRSLFTDYPGLEALRLRFHYGMTDTVNASGDLNLPGVAAPVPVLRIRRVLSAEWFLEGSFPVPPGWTELYRAANLTWFNPSEGAPPPSAAWISFLNTIKGQVDARMENISGGGGLIDNTNSVNGMASLTVYSFLSATDKEELAVGRVVYDQPTDQDNLVSVTFKDFNPPAALQLMSAVSRKTHGAAGEFDIALPLTGEPGVECRSSGGNHTLAFTCSNNVVSGSASVSGGTGVAGAPSFAGNTMTVNLTGVTDVQKITVTLSNVTDSLAQVLPSTAVSVNMLVGDTSGNKSVNGTDISQTKLQSGAVITAANFREDVNVNGSINGTDVSLVKLRSGSGLPSLHP